MISVALCSYNGEAYIAEQLTSILNQTNPPDEIVIVDDASTDDTAAIIDDIRTTTSIAIHLIVNETNLGVTRNFAKALSLCKGELILIADQDDVWFEHKIETMMAAFKEQNNHALLLYSDAQMINDAGEPIAQSYMAHQKLRPQQGKPFMSITVINCIPGCTMMLHRDLLQQLMPIPDEAILHDWWIALLASLVGHIHYIPTPLMQYRLHTANAWTREQTLRATKQSGADKMSVSYRLVRNYNRIAKQAQAAASNANNEERSPQWSRLVSDLNASGVRRFRPFISNKIRRQGILRWLTFLLGAFLSLFMHRH